MGALFLFYFLFFLLVVSPIGLLSSHHCLLNSAKLLNSSSIDASYTTTWKQLSDEKVQSTVGGHLACFPSMWESPALLIVQRLNTIVLYILSSCWWCYFYLFAFVSSLQLGEQLLYRLVLRGLLSLPRFKFWLCHLAGIWTGTNYWTTCFSFFICKRRQIIPYLTELLWWLNELMLAHCLETI